MAYGYIGSMRTRHGRRDDVVAVLVGGADARRAAGCLLYVVNVSTTDPDVLWVYEAWESKEHHDASLRQPETRAAIECVMPMLTGEFTSVETTVVGGLGG